MTLRLKEITELAEAHGISVKEESVKINESGLDFQVAHAEDKQGSKWILRIPRRKDAAAKTRLEKRVLEAVNQHVSFETPVWKVCTNELIAYKQLTGIPAGTLDAEAQNFIWEIDEKHVPESYHKTLGRALAELHQVPKAKLTVPGLTMHTVEESKADMARRMKAVKEKTGVEKALWTRWQTWLANDAMWPKATGLIHGEVHPGHTIINARKEVTGLIDWTEAAVTDVSRDFMAHHMTFGNAALEQLIAAYKQAGGITWPHMKEHIIELTSTTPIDLAEFAEESGSEEYMQLAKEQLGVLE